MANSPRIAEPVTAVEVSGNGKRELGAAPDPARVEPPGDQEAQIGGVRILAGAHDEFELSLGLSQIGAGIPVAIRRQLGVKVRGLAADERLGMERDMLWTSLVATVVHTAA